MSKKIDATFGKFASITNAASKFSASAATGQRIIPNKTKDNEFQLRIDAGHYDTATKQLNVVLQVNSNPTSPALAAWVKKNSTHAKLATATFDTVAKDKNAEYSRMLAALQSGAKGELK